MSSLYLDHLVQIPEFGHEPVKLIDIGHFGDQVNGHQVIRGYQLGLGHVDLLPAQGGDQIFYERAAPVGGNDNRDGIPFIFRSPLDLDEPLRVADVLQLRTVPRVDTLRLVHA